jgi:hypothetical protein
MVVPRGIYLSVVETVIGWRPLTPVWAVWSWFFKDRLQATVTVSGRVKLHPALPEAYQLAMSGGLAFGVWNLPVASATSAMSIAFLVLAWYRAWEILIYALKWLLVGPIEPEPLYDFRRSLLCFVVNVVEVAAAFTIIALPVELATGGGHWSQVKANIAAAFTLDVPTNLAQPYATLFSLESTVLVLFVLACVIGGIERKTEAG